MSKNIGANFEQGIIAFNNEKYSHAYDLLKPYSDAGNIEAQYLLAKILFYSSTNEKEENIAFDMLLEVCDISREKAKQNDISAQYRLVHMYSNTSQLLLDIEEAKSWAEKAAKQGHVAAAYELSQLLQGKKSYIWLKYAADHGDSEAQWNLGNIYAFGDLTMGIQMNRILAFEYYKLAAKNGFDMAFYDFAIDLVTGDAGKKDLKEGLKWMMRAAENKNVAAIKFFVNAYTNGYCGIKTDVKKAMYWNQKYNDFKKKLGSD